MRLTLPFVLIALATTASADVWTVDDNGPASFTSIQAAIDAASDGDVILVQDGNYAGFTIDNKDLSVIGVGSVGTTTAAGGSLIANVSTGRSAVVSRLTLSGADGVQALNIESCAGAIRLHDCAITGFSPTAICRLGTDALTVTGANNIVLTNCGMLGGTGKGGGGYSPFFGYYGCSGAGGRGISILATSMALYNVDCSGGNAGIVTIDYSIGASARGGDGFDGGGCFIFASEAPMSGGRGAGFSVSANVCNWGAWFEEQGRGGHGCSFESANASTAWFTIPTFAKGTYGPSNCGYTYPEWPPAKLFVRGPAGSVARRAGGVGHRTTMPAHLAGTTNAAATFTGAPGELVDVLISPLPSFVWSQAMQGVWSIDTASALGPMPVGIVDATGQLVTSITFPALAPGEPNHTWFVQPVFIATASTLGAPATVTLVP